jgi:hypothetical protein
MQAFWLRQIAHIPNARGIVAMGGHYPFAAPIELDAKHQAVVLLQNALLLAVFSVPNANGPVI